MRGTILVPGFLIGVELVTASCGSNSAPTTPTTVTTPNPTPSPSPTPAPTPTPQPPPTVSLTGVVRAENGSVLVGATVRILDGANAGRSTRTGNSGGYRFDGLTSENANLSAVASRYDESRSGLFIDGTNTLNFTLRTTVPWGVTGGSNSGWPKPLYVTRVAITGSYTGSSQSFMMWCDSSLLVNVILGTSAGHSTTYSGEHPTPSCTAMHTEMSTGVSWSVTELR